MATVLERIDGPQDLKALSFAELEALASEARAALIAKASACGGHLASNLGVVELTIALHYVFDSPVDKIVFDVSHQCYTHKMLTGRRDAFLDPARYSSVSGFTNPEESEHDHFNVGHTSTSISLACGLAKGRDLCGGDEDVVAVIGDASLGGGQALEALNCASEVTDRLIVVVNDNGMSIPESHGALRAHLNQLVECDGLSPANLFELAGFDYVLVNNGHDLPCLIEAFERAKRSKGLVVVHCRTVKGRGYRFAERDQEKWHHAHPFLVPTGKFESGGAIGENYGAIVGSWLIDAIERDSGVVAMTASVPACFGFTAERRRKAGRQFVDVGIAEQNLVTMAAALGKRGCRPVAITESSFFQRAYDQFEQELCKNGCAATFLVAFSGVYGHTDDTHIGLYDIALLGNVPELTYLAPSNKEEYLAMLDWSVFRAHRPVAIRIPWNGVHHARREVPSSYDCVAYETVLQGDTVAVLALGSFFQLGEQVVDGLSARLGINATLVNPRFITGVDADHLRHIGESHEVVVTLEDGIVSGGFGARIAQFYSESNVKVLNRGFSMEIPRVFTPDEMLRANGLTPEQIIDSIAAAVKPNRTRRVEGPESGPEIGNQHGVEQDHLNPTRNCTRPCLDD